MDSDDKPSAVALRVIPVSLGNLYFSELSFQFRKKHIGNLFRRTIPFDPTPTFELRRIVARRNQSLRHCVRIDFVLNLLRKLFLHNAPIAFNGERLGNVLPIHNAISSHLNPSKIIYNLSILREVTGKVNSVGVMYYTRVEKVSKR